MSDPTPPVVSVDWLAERLEAGAADLVVADCRFQLGDAGWGEAQYRAGHIPGAVYFHLERDLSGPPGTHGGRHPLPAPDALAATLAAAGITRTRTMVVAYDSSRLAFAARLWWLLGYYGHDRIAVLDGGWSAWQAAGLATQTAIPIPERGDFQPQLRRERAVTAAEVRSRLERPRGPIVDSRDPRRYRGEWEPIDPIAGHIRGACNLPWQEATDAEGYLRSPAEQRARWQGLGNFQEAIVYCGSGVTACVNLLSLEVASLPGGKLYAGSWSDWCSYLGGAAVNSKYE